MASLRELAGDQTQVEQEPTGNSLASLAAEPDEFRGVSGEILERMLINNESAESLLPGEQGILAKSVIDSMENPQDTRSRLNNSVILSHLFNTDIEETNLLQPDMIRSMYGEELNAIAAEAKLREEYPIWKRAIKGVAGSIFKSFETLVNEGNLGMIVEDLEVLRLDETEKANFNNMTLDQYRELSREKQNKLPNPPRGTAEEEVKKVHDQILQARENVRSKRFGDINKALSVPPAEDFGEKMVDIGAGVVGFTAKIAFAKQILGGRGITQEVAAFEVTTQLDGSKPGVGSLIALGLAGIHKLPSTGIKGTVGKLSAQGGLFAGITAAEGGSAEDIAIAFLIPFALKATGQAKALVGDAAIGQFFKAKFPDLRIFSNAEVARANRAAKDWVKVNKGKMSRDQWSQRHGAFAVDFAQRKTAAEKPVQRAAEAQKAITAPPAETGIARPPASPIEAATPPPAAKVTPKPTVTPPKAVEAKPEAVELTDQGPIGVWEEGVLLEDTPKELAKVITEVRKNEGDAAAKIVKRLQDAGIDTTSTHFNEETGEITVRAMNISDENKAILEKRGVTITQFPPMKGDYLIFKPVPTAKPAEAAKPPTITDRQLLDERKAITSTPAKKRTLQQIKRVTEIEDELILRHADEFPDIDITPKARSAEIKKVETQITQNGVYQAALDAVGDLPDLSGSFNVDSTEIGDIRARFEGRPDILRKFNLQEFGGKRWDSQHDELGLPQDTTLDEFMDKIELFVDSNKAGKGLIHEAALAQALNDAQGSDEQFDVELFALKHDMLKNGFTAAEINKEVKRHAEENDVDLADLEADLIPLQEITDVGKKQQILRELDRTIRADKVKKVSDPEKIAIAKAGKVAAKTQKPAFIREKDGKFTVTKIEPRKGDFIKVTPAPPGELEGKIERLKGKPKGPPPQTREAKLLIQRINIEKKKKGLTDKDFSDIKLQQGGSRRLTGTKPRTEEQLRAILKAVKRARPKVIGHKTVVNLKTERQITSLKDSLSKVDLMTDEAFDDILARETGGRLPKYINNKAFITQREGRDVINRMHDIAERLRATESFNRAIDKNSEIAIEFDKLVEKGEFLGAKSPARLLSMRFFVQRMGERTGEPIYHIWQDLTFTHQSRGRERRKLLNSVEEMPGFTDIAQSEKALQRISDYISSQSKLTNAPKSPEDITSEEKAIAKRIQEIFRLYEFQARLGKFFEHKENLSQMPQYLKYKKSIDRALDIYDSEGLDPLIEYIKTQPWGIIRSGYEPTESVIRKVSTHRLPDIAIGKSHIKVRGIEYAKQDRNILQRLDSYMRQMDMMSFLQPKIKALVRTADDVLDQFDEPSKVGSAISVYLDNLKRTNYEDGLVEEVFRKIYSQSITTLVLADPTKPVRNLLQNVAFAEDRKDFLNPDNKKLSTRDVEYMETFVHQDRVMLSDWAFVGEEPLDLPVIGQKRFGLEKLTKWVQRRTLYPASDRLNRTASFWAKTNRIKRAFSKNTPLAEKMKEARFSDMQKPEQQMALGILARDGVDAMTRYVAKVHTDNTHFLYAREQRSPAEQTKLGKMVLNLALFKRAALEKATLQAQKAVKAEGTFESRKRAAFVFVNLIVWSTLTNLLWKKMTGKKFGAYDFINFLEFEAGGLQLGAVDTITDVYNNMLRASKGDSKALEAANIAITKSGDMFIPFYDLGLRAVEAMIGAENIDRLPMRKLRETIDSEYKSRGIQEVDRTLVEKLQFVLAKSKPDKKKKKAPRIE